MLESAAQILAVITDALSIVTGPRTLSARVKHLDVVSLDDRNALLILLLEGNLLRQQVVELSQAGDQLSLSHLAAQLNDRLRGLGTEAISAMSTTAPQPAVPGHPLFSEVAGHIVTVMEGADAAQDTVVVHDGVRNLLHQPEFGDIDMLRQVLDVVEEERALSQILAAMDVDQGVQIVIGAENAVEQLRGCSLVLTTYRAGETRRGTIGVLGPTRMRYPQVAPRLRYVSQRVGKAIDRMLG